MNISELMEIVRGSLTEEDFIPVQRLKDKEFVKEMQKKVALPTYEQVAEVAEKLEEPIDRFYINLKTLFTPIVYFYNGFLLEIHALDDDYLRDFHVKESIKLNVELLEKILQDHDYETYFIRTDSKVRIMMFKRLFNEIPDKDLFEVFLMVYSYADYEFSALDKNCFPASINVKLKNNNNSLNLP